MAILFQLLILAAVVELFVQCMPGSLRRASKQNRFRLDGTLSENRVYRERRALNRLRLDLLAIFVIVFLTGNALYHTIDSQIMPVSGIFHQQLTDETTAVQPTAVASQAAQLWETRGNSVLLLTGLWCVMCSAIIIAGVFRAYRGFGAGVHERSAENFHLDMTRMSISGSEFAAEMLSNQLGSGRSVAG